MRARVRPDQENRMNAATLRRPLRVGAVLALVLTAACASAGRPGTFTRLLITGEEIREAEYRTAYEALSHHREILLFEGQLGFKRGNDDDSDNVRIMNSGLFHANGQEWYIPMLVVDGDFNLNDAVTELRRIDAAEIVVIRLYRSSMVPPQYRRPGAEGGVIEVRTH